MSLRDRINGSVMATVGYILSPLSWWNDLYVNLPIAYGLAWLVSLFRHPLFPFALVFFYWCSNLAGLILLHRGVTKAIPLKGRKVGRQPNGLVADLLVSVVYSLVVAALAWSGVLRLPQEYLSSHPR